MEGHLERNMKMVKVSWEAEDGYCGKSRPQEFEFNYSDWISNDAELPEIEQALGRALDEDFESKITPAFLDFDFVIETVKSEMEQDRINDK